MDDLPSVVRHPRPPVRIKTAEIPRPASVFLEPNHPARGHRPNKDAPPSWQHRAFQLRAPPLRAKHPRLLAVVAVDELQGKGKLR